ATDPTADGTVLRYLAAYGPASVADAQKWLSLTRLKAVFDRLRPRLVTYRDAAGRELFDLAGTELPDPGSPVPPLLLGPFDNVLLAHADRTRIIDKADERRVFTKNGIVRGTLLLDGRVAGVWQPELRRTSAAVELRPFTALSGADKDRLAAAASDLLAFAAPEAEKTDVVFADPA
ncbi:DNA glycosylase AlkZ-like family protein, partial [Streptomyces phytophilus]|uniref:DNA glycosylase AlkZ-like family protein n=1 Tax=Streptomyces phytophilus TaxID=722715 RepID=UPI0015F0BCE7